MTVSIVCWLLRLAFLGVFIIIVCGLRPDESMADLRATAWKESPGAIANRSLKSEFITAADVTSKGHSRRTRSINADVEVTNHTRLLSTTSDSTRRTKLCGVLKDFEQSSRSLDRALENQTLSAVFTKTCNTYIFKGSSPGEYSGFDHELLQAVAKRGGFKVNVHEDESDHESDPSSDDDIWLMQRLKDYDLNLCHHSNTHARQLKGASLAFEFLDSSLVLVVNRTGLHPPISLLGVFRPYDRGVWASFVLLTLITGAAYWYLEGRGRSSEELQALDRSDRDDKQGVMISIWYTLMHLTTISSYVPLRWPSRILVASWSYFSVCLVAGYTANLAANLTVEHSVGYWNGIEDAMNEQAIICTRVAGSKKYMDEHYPNYKRVNAAKSDPFERMHDGQCDAAIMWKTNFEVAQENQKYNPECALERFGPPLTVSYGGWMVYQDYSELCTVLVGSVIKSIMQGMDEDGTLKKLYDEKLLAATRTRARSCNEEILVTGNDNDHSLHLRSVASIFIFHSGAMLVAIGAAVCCRKSSEPDDAEKAAGELEMRDLHSW